MKSHSISNQTMIGTIILVYWVPLVVLCTYGSPGKSWTLVAAGLLLSTMGSMALLLLMRKWEQGMQLQFQGQGKEKELPQEAIRQSSS